MKRRNQIFVLGCIALIIQMNNSTAQSPQNLKGKFEKSYVGDQIVVPLYKPTQATRKLFNSRSKVFVAPTVLKEVETAVKALYNIENRLVNLKIGSKKKQFLNLSSHVGAKGWQANARGLISKKRKATFDLNYQFSIENHLRNGMGHQMMITTKF